MRPRGALWKGECSDGAWTIGRWNNPKHALPEGNMHLPLSQFFLVPIHGHARDLPEKDKAMRGAMRNWFACKGIAAEMKLRPQRSGNTVSGFVAGELPPRSADCATSAAV